MNLADRARQFLARRQFAYKKTFGGPPGQEVLRDLAKFCRAQTSTFHADPRAHAMLEGRREVWLRIMDHLHLTDTQLFDLMNGKDIDVPR